MKVELFPFQQKACNRLRQHLEISLHNYQENAEQTVVSFTAPTGAGKTIIMASLIENILCGDEQHEAKTNSIFVWLSDSPQLNEQSKIKIETKADRIVIGQCVTIDDKSFTKEYLDDGHIYFLNTQKLSKSSNLTKRSDSRQFTIWETLSKTIREKSDRLYFIIDEAHRGAQGNEATRATTIMQRFIKGYTKENAKDDGIEIERDFPPMPVVIGMSATIERFNKLVGGTAGNVYQCNVSPEEVRASGLLKDQIYVEYPENNGIGSGMSVLQAAAIEWKNKWDHWEKYCTEQGCEQINPVFVVQVLNKKDDQKTQTDLANCISIIEERTGFHFRPGEVVHTFGQTNSALDVNGLEVRFVEPSQISDDMNIKVVFFKENLSTGWDCPRAETMASFRSATDSTHIAQLLGRMVRTPLQRRIEGDESLNEVHLYLPNFDKKTVEDVVKQYRETEGGEIIVPNNDTEKLIANSEESKEIIKFINHLGLMTHKVRKSKVTDYLISLHKLTHLLAQSGFYTNAIKDVHNEIADKIHIYVKSLEDGGTYETLATQFRRFEIHAQILDPFGQTIANREEQHELTMTDEDVERQYRIAEKRLGDAGVGKVYANKYVPNNSIKYRIDVILYTFDATCKAQLDSYARDKFHALRDEYRLRIAVCESEQIRSRWNAIVAEGDPVSPHNFHIPEVLISKFSEGYVEYSDHLLVNPDTGTAKIVLNSWEEATLREEQNRSDYVSWVRNPSRGTWSLCISYQHNGETKTCYPDLLIVRKAEDGYVVDILEPHNPSFDDNVGKAKAFAKYAGENQMVGRIQLIRLMPDASGNNRLCRLDMAKSEVRNYVSHIVNAEELNNLFATHGTFEE